MSRSKQLVEIRNLSLILHIHATHLQLAFQIRKTEASGIRSRLINLSISPKKVKNILSKSNTRLKYLGRWKALQLNKVFDDLYQELEKTVKIAIISG